MRIGHAVVALLVGASLTACGGVTAGPASVSGTTPALPPLPVAPSFTPTPSVAPVAAPPPTPFPVRRVTQQQPSQLIGVWEVTAEGVADGSLLRIARNNGYDEMTLRTPDCTFEMPFAAAKPDVLAVSSATSDGTCPRLFGPPFFRETRAFASVGDGFDFINAAGKVVARLSPAGDSLDAEAARALKMPRFTKADAAQLDAMAVRPRGLRAAKPAELVGDWAPEDTGLPEARITMRGAGAFSAFGGACNGVSGSWSAAQGVFVATRGVSTLVGCTNDPRPESVPGVRTAAFDGEVLVISDEQGALVGRFVRVPQGSGTTPP